MIERHYSHLTPRLKKEMLTGKRYDTPHKEYTADLSKGFAVTDEDLQRAIDDVEIEEKLPNEPKAIAVAKSGSKRSEATSDEENVKNAQASLKALEMLSRGSLSEKSALAAIGTYQDAYSVGPDVRIKALELVEQGKLSERGLIAILGV
jgi:ATP phosphoribosyltransferase regulatory subunit HisZ